MEALLERVQAYLLLNWQRFALAIIVLLIGAVLIRLINRAIRKLFARTPLDRTVEVFIERSVSAFLWVVLILAVLANFGVNVSGFIAGLGVIGFIIGFATKDIFANLAAGLLLLTTRPFDIKDHVEVGGIKGVVRDINIAACVLISEGIEVTVPNAKIYGMPIKNFSRKQK